MASTQEIEKVKGRAMFYWAGKQAISTVKHYPAQLVEKIGKKEIPQSLNLSELKTK